MSVQIMPAPCESGHQSLGRKSVPPKIGLLKNSSDEVKLPTINLFGLSRIFFGFSTKLYARNPGPDNKCAGSRFWIAQHVNHFLLVLLVAKPLVAQKRVAIGRQFLDQLGENGSRLARQHRLGPNPFRLLSRVRNRNTMDLVKSDFSNRFFRVLQLLRCKLQI